MSIYKDHDRLRFVNTDQKVIVPYGKEGLCFRGTVTIAAGHHARVTSSSGSVSVWRDVTSLFPDDGRIPDGHPKIVEPVLPSSDTRNYKLPRRIELGNE